MNLEAMTVFVRNQAQTDEEDAPSANLEVYARAAYEDIQGRVFPWPNKKVEYTITSNAGQARYLWANLSVGDMQFVSSVVSSDGVLMRVSEDDYRNLSSGSGTADKPTVFAVDQNGIWLWPTPAGETVLTVTGYRSFGEWPQGSAEPDLSRGFDAAICWYMLSKYYQAQEDLELAQMYANDYERTVAQQIERALRSSKVSAGPLLFGGDPRLVYSGRSYTDWVKQGVEG